MPKLIQSCVDEVKRRATIEEVVPMWGVALKRKGANLSGLCPFHDEKSGSFNVRPGKGYKCFGCGAAGDAVGFVMKKDGIEFIPAIEALAEKFGVLLQFEAVEPRPVEGRESNVEGQTAQSSGTTITLPKGVDVKTAERAIKRQANWERQKKDEDRLELELLNAWLPSVERRKLFGWSKEVRTLWEAGENPDDRFTEELVAARGWPMRWLRWLLDEHLISWPALPWNDDTSAVALRVDGPKRFGSGPISELAPVGYHQRFEIRGEKSWAYVPYLPAEDKRHTDFQHEMVAAETARRDDLDVAMCPGLPFVMGSPVGVRFLVITEGQWDAVTFAGACGWLESETTWPEGAMVMGARGANGVDTLLAYWGEWLEATVPAILVLADNDTAGKRWDEPQPLDKELPGSPLLPTFAQKLLKRPGATEAEPEWVARARKVTVQRINPTYGKDFNDYWKAKRPTPAQMMAWLRTLGYLGSKGEWL